METKKINKRVLLSLSLFALLFLASPISCAQSVPSYKCTQALGNLQDALNKYVTNPISKNIKAEENVLQNILKTLYREVEALKSSNKAVADSVMNEIDKLLVKAEKKLYEGKLPVPSRRDTHLFNQQLDLLHKLQDRHTKYLRISDRFRASWRRFMRRPIYNPSKWLLGASLLSFVGFSCYGWLIEKVNKNTVNGDTVAGGEAKDSDFKIEDLLILILCVLLVVLGIMYY